MLTSENCWRRTSANPWSLGLVAIVASLSIPTVSLGQVEQSDPGDANSSEIREIEANEDPLAHRKRGIQSSSSVDSKIGVYGSVRVRNRWTDSDNVWEDFGSRVGLDGWYETAPEKWLFARYELGFNLLEELESDSLPSLPGQELGRTLFTRLAYGGLQFGDNVVALGKNWSTYYQVAAFADRFDSVGGEASGAFPAQTDGGASGTGRADDVLQGRFNFEAMGQSAKPLSIEVNVQVQAGQEIPGLGGFEYDHAYGVSSIVRLANDVDIGIAYNHSEVDLNRLPVSDRNGLDGDLSAFLIGARWHNDDWYLGATWSRTSNLHRTDALTYFDGEGIEFYGQYRIASDVWFLAGFNQLTPESNQSQAGEFRLEYSVLGVRYLFDGFRRMLYLESRIDSGRTSIGLDQDDQVIFGIRWGFSTNQE